MVTKNSVFIFYEINATFLSNKWGKALGLKMKNPFCLKKYRIIKEQLFKIWNT